MLPAPRFSLNTLDWASFGQACFKYTGPLMLVFLVQIQAGQPLKTALFTVYGAALQLVINILTKYLDGTTNPKV
jgi:hypothetical protein